VNTKLIELLKLIADGETYSGEVLGEKLGISRTAVWKYLAQLKDYGLQVDSVRGVGYCLPQPISFLSRDAILNQLSFSLPFDFSVESSIVSTNQSLLNDASVGQDIHSQALFAEYQSGGRGRRGRSWQSPFASNIYLSIGWRYPQGIAVIEGLSLAVGVGICRALCALGVDQARLKWPNDVLYDGRKLAGVLIEVSGDVSGDCCVVVGVGLNVNMPKNAAIDQPWVDLSSVNGGSMDRNLVAAALLNELVPMLEGYPAQSFAAYKNEWEQLNAYKGIVVEVSSGRYLVSGECLGVSNSGALRLKVGAEQKEFSGGELSLRKG